MPLMPSSHLLLSPSDISKAVRQHAASAQAILIMSAWATDGESLDALRNTSAATRKCLIGTQLCGTSPDALTRLLRLGFDLKIIERTSTSGIFHPKCYLFRHGSTWSAVIGNANLTHAAFTSNSEVAVLARLSRSQADAFHMLFDTMWNSDGAIDLSDRWLRRYTTQWLKMHHSRFGHHLDREGPQQRQAARRVRGARVRELAALTKADWRRYLAELHKMDSGRGTIDDEHDSYLATLRLTRPILCHQGLASATKEQIGRVIGKRDPCGWFGRISLIRGEMANFYSDSALRARVDRLLQPLRAPDLSESQAIERAKDVYVALRKIDGMGSGIITRLFTLLRPDRFFSVNARSVNGLSTLFALPKSRLQHDPDAYAESLHTIYRCPWYRSPCPARESERAIWRARVALLDRYVYSGDT